MTTTDERIKKIVDVAQGIFKEGHFMPRNGVTFCNIATAEWILRMGLGNYHGYLVESMIQHLTLSGRWDKMTSEDAFLKVNIGVPTVSALSAGSTQHICVCLPGQREWSQKWGEFALSCMDIGRAYTFGKSTAWAFHDLPGYYVYNGSLD